MCRRRSDRGGEVFRGRHVHDRVVDKDGIKGCVQAEGSHVASSVFGFGVDLPALREHVLGQVRERHRVTLLQEARVVAASAAELEDLFDRAFR